jgi:hypothetical protein
VPWLAIQKIRLASCHLLSSLFLVDSPMIDQYRCPHDDDDFCGRISLPLDSLMIADCQGYWTISWGALNIFNVSNTDGGDNLRREEVNLFAVAHGICHSISSFVELIILLLLCTSSIGKNNFYRSWFVARYNFVSLAPFYFSSSFSTASGRWPPS